MEEDLPDVEVELHLCALHPELEVDGAVVARGLQLAQRGPELRQYTAVPHRPALARACTCDNPLGSPSNIET